MLVARPIFATYRPFGVARTSGSPVRLPTSITLLTIPKPPENFQPRLRSKPRGRIDRPAVDLDLEVQMGAGRQAGRADLAHHFTGHHGLTRGHMHAPEVAVEQPHVLVDDLDHVNAGAAWIEPRMCNTGRGRVHRAARRRRKVDPGVDVQPRAERVERLEGEERAAKGKRLDRARNNRPERKPLLARDSRPRHRPHEKSNQANRHHPQHRHHACTIACSARWKAALTVVSSLCATFSEPPIAPGTLNTTSRAAKANRWWTGVNPFFSIAKPIARTNSWAGCIKRLVMNSELHCLAMWCVSGSVKRRPASGAVMASTTRNVYRMT